MQTNCITPTVRPKTKYVMKYAYTYVYAYVRLRHVHGVSSYSVDDGCTAKTEIRFIQFQLLIFPLPLPLI